MLGSVSVPGPPAGLWALSLALWGAQAAVVGEAVRGVAGRYLTLLRPGEAIERLVLDLYLGGAVLYLLAAVELGAFTPPVVLAVPVVAAAVLLYRVGRVRARGEAARAAERLLRGLGSGWAIVALASALGLYLVEVAVASPVASGNTYDSSLLSTYVALLLQHGSVPLSFRPYGAASILYPQGSTVWLGWAQLDFGLPPARTALLVTPLFLALPPLAGYVLGRRLVGSERAGAAFALALAFLGPSTRALVGGSNDFVLATPLVLLLAARSMAWGRPGAPSARDAATFGLLLGYAGALNVVGTEWMLPALLVLGVSSTPRFGGRLVAWGARWLTAAGAALVAGIPSIYVLVLARARPASLAGELSVPSSRAVGIGLAQWIGEVDPFLFRASDTALSPVPIVRLELAVLLVAGAGALIVLATAERASSWSAFSRWAASAGLAVVGWELLLLASGVPGSPVRDAAFVSNAGELGVSLFVVYGLVAAVPIALALERVGQRHAADPPGPGATRRTARQAELRALAPFALAVVLIVPAAVLTPTSLSPVLQSYYHDFGSVSGADFALLEDASAFVPAGSRVLVAPGSAAEFLPGYVRGITLLYPMEPGFSRANGSYSLVVRDLTNGTLDVSVLAAIAALAPEFIVVTGNNTVLWGAFWASPLHDATYNGTATFPVVWHDQDAWIFDASACRPEHGHGPCA